MRLAGRIGHRQGRAALQRPLVRLAAWLETAGRPAVDPCLWPPLGLAIGIIAFFAAPAAPGLAVSLGAGLAFILLRAAARRLWGQTLAGLAVALAAWAGLGWCAGAARVAVLGAPVRSGADSVYEFAGWVSRVDPGARPAVTVEITQFERGSPEEWPRRVRVRVTGPVPGLGEGVSGLAELSAPPGPAMPGAYDFSRRAWFDQLGGTGFSYGALEPARIEGGGFTRALARVRGRAADRIRAASERDSAAIIAALATGDRSAITEEHTETLRASGLGHLLAISGLHMTLIGGGAFFLVVAGLALIEPLARNRDVRKPAAIAAILVSLAYLALSGAPVSAQRAFVMLAIAFLAVITDRPVLTLRNVSVAAVAMLLISPEALQEAGFQMSFAAAASLIAAYEFWRANGPRMNASAPSRFLGGLSFTSLVAGSATGAFAGFHFNRWASYGLFANLAAMPLFTIAVMPLTALALVMTPVGLEALPARLAAWAMDGVLAIGRFAETAPGAVSTPPSGAGYALAIYAAGLAFLIAGRGMVRLGGVVVMALAGVLWAATPRPQGWISGEGDMIWVEAGRVYASSLRRDRYERDLLLRRLGLPEESPAAPLASRFACDPNACQGEAGGVRLARIAELRALAEACASADLVIFPETASARARRLCGAELLDANALRDAGAFSLHVRSGDYQLIPASRTRWRAPTPWFQ